MSRSSGGPKQDPKTGRWWFITDAGFENGRRKQARRRGFKTKREAQEALDRLRVKVADKVYVAPSNQTFREFAINEWTKGEASSEGTLESYDRVLRLHILPRIGDVELQKLEPGHLKRLYADLAADGGRADGKPGGLSPRSIEYVATIVHAVLKEAVANDRIVRSPADRARPKFDKSKSKAKKPKVWKPEQVGAFLAGIPDDRYRPILFFLASTGCRRSEAGGLEWREVDLERGTAMICRTLTVVKHKLVPQESLKNDRDREIQLDARTVAMLRSWKATQARERLLVGEGWRDDDYVFTKPDGRPLDPEEVSRAFLKRVARLGLPSISLHGLRHTWATSALHAGVPAKVVQEVLGHSSISVTLDTYTHAGELQAGAVSKVADLMFGGE